MSRLDRLQKCGLYRVPTAPAVTVRVGADGIAGISGVQVCGLVWACPVCSAKIRQRRSADLERLVLAHVNAGGGAAFGTLTLPHGRGDRLKPLLVAVAESWQAVRRSRGVRAAMDTHGVVGFVRAVEVTIGENGWHPHLHVLALTAAPLTDDALADVGAAIASAWRKAVVAHGFREPSIAHGVRWQQVAGAGGGAALARYLTKVQDDGFGRSIGAEMTRGDLKAGRRRSRSISEILEGAIRGDVDSLRLWWEFEQATRGHRVLTWSTGLRRRLGALAAEQSDDELADQVDGVVVAELTADEWRDVVTYAAEARLLDAAEIWGADGVSEVLRSLALRRQWDERAGPGGPRPRISAAPR